MFFILFFGTREVVRDVDRPGADGYAVCPRCDQYARFRPRSSRTWVHLFWIPVVPLGQATPIQECVNCGLRMVTP